MSMNIGFDFGTTNSIISFFNAESQALDCFRRNAADASYVPTVVAYAGPGEREEVKIGAAAKREEGGPNCYSRFKLRLGADFDAPAALGGERTVHQVARDYISRLLGQFEEANGPISRMVMTIPNAWYRERGADSAREHLRALLRETGLKPEQFQFQSEPIAAAAYFCWRWQQANGGKAYRGKLVIVDYGGGTLDVTLCESDGENHVRLIASQGSGGKEGPGCGGSAFDAEVVRRVCAEAGLEPDGPTLARAANELERYLIDDASAVRDAMEDYAIDPEMNDVQLCVLNALDGAALCCRQLQEAFDQVCRGELVRALEGIGARELDPRETKIVLVGGFSNFCCVESCAREFFGGRLDGADNRFPGVLSRENRALAIAKGAALIAGERIRIEPPFPYELGIVALAPDPERPEELREEFVPLIRRGDAIRDYGEPRYSAARLWVAPEALGSVQLYAGEGSERRAFPLEGELSRLFPAGGEGRNWQLGIRLDGEGNPTLCARCGGAEGFLHLNLPPEGEAATRAVGETEEGEA